MRARFVVAPVAALGVALVPGVALAAGGGYGPSTATGPSGSPGGYSEMLGTKSVDASGGNFAVSVPGGSASIQAPVGAFASPVQIEATKPDLTQITGESLSGAGFSGFNAVAGIGVKVLDASGQPVTGKFAKPITVTITGTGLGKAGEKAIAFTGSAGATVLPTTLGPNSITITIDEDPNIAVIDPTTATASTVANATSTHTGIPVAGEVALAGAIALGGAGVLMAARRRATAHR